MISVKGASFGRFGGWRRRYPGGSECRSIFLTVSRAMPNRLAASRWLRPSTWQASRTRRYRSTVYILPPSISKKIEGYRWQSFTPPAAGKSRRFRGLICHRRSHSKASKLLPRIEKASRTLARLLGELSGESLDSDDSGDLLRPPSEQRLFPATLFRQATLDAAEGPGGSKEAMRRGHCALVNALDGFFFSSVGRRQSFDTLTTVHSQIMKKRVSSG